MFQFTGFHSPGYVLTRRYHLRGGLPHSEIHGSKLTRSSPRLIAACHVLHRLLTPRHPPDALLLLERSAVTSRTGPASMHPQSCGHVTVSSIGSDARPLSSHYIRRSHLFTLSKELVFQPAPQGRWNIRIGKPIPTASICRRAGRNHIASYVAKTVVRAVFRKVVGPGGLEPPTSRLSGVCSNQLSYRPAQHPDKSRLRLRRGRDAGTAVIVLRKEVIQPQVPLRLPCYDFTPVADLTVDGYLKS